MLKKKQSYKLLSKTTSIYLVFTLIAFFGSALFLTRKADEFIDKDIEHRFFKSEHRIKRYIELGKPLNTLGPYNQVSQLPGNIPIEIYPIYTDTLIYNSEIDEIQHFRKKSSILEVNGKHYSVVIIKSMDDFIRLRDDIIGALIPAFISLAIIILLFNIFLSGYFFRPFNKILHSMKNYKIGQRIDIEAIKTNTLEFKKMQDLFLQMINRIENDYLHLKEYTENMAHEIQTPLTIIRNKVENLIADEEVMQHHAESVKIIYDETNLLSTLGNTLNLLTKIENGEFNNAIHVSTRAVIEKHISAIFELVQLKSLSIETDFCDEHILIIDPLLLDIILKNLLRNAVSYGTTDGPIRIQTTPDILIISNYGPPLEIPESKLFKRFSHNHDKTSSLGLGLALVDKICQLNELHIQYQYHENQHTFRIKKAV